MRLLTSLLFASAMALGQGQTTANITPASTGQKLGSVNQRWDAFIQNLDVNGTLTLSGPLTISPQAFSALLSSNNGWTGNQTFGGLTTFTGAATHAAAETFTGPTVVPLPAAANQAEVHSNALNNGDAQSIIPIVKEVLAPNTVTQVPKNWNLNSVWAAGTGTAGIGYGNVWTPTNAVFRIAGCGPTQFLAKGATGTDPQYFGCQRQTVQGPFSIEFVYHAEWLVFSVLDAQPKFRVVINGKPVSHYYQVGGSSNGTVTYIVPFKDPDNRVSLQFMRGYVSGLITPNGNNSGDITAADWNVGRPVVVGFGNSYVHTQQSAGTNPITGATTTLGNLGFVQRLADLTGANIYASGNPGTDFVNNGGTSVTYSGRVTQDGCNQNPAVVLWLFPGWNDKSLTGVRAAALAAFQAVQACSTHPLQLVFGPIAADGPTDTAIASVDSDIKNAVNDAVAAGVNIKYVASPIDEQWVTGTHANCGTFLAVGNSCYLTGADGVHPTQEGSEFYGVKLANRLMQLYPQYFSPFDFSTPIQASTAKTIRVSHWRQDMTGTVSVSNGSTAVTGVGTKFLEELQVGQSIVVGYLSGGCNLTPVTIQSIPSDTSLTLSANWACTTQPAGTLYQLAVSPLPEAERLEGNGNLTLSGIASALGLVVGGGQAISSTSALPTVIGCGTTGTCANTTNGAVRIVYGSMAMAAGTATMSGLTPAFTATTSYVCIAVDLSAINPVRCQRASASSVTITGTGTDSVAYILIGN